MSIAHLIQRMLYADVSTMSIARLIQTMVLVSSIGDANWDLHACFVSWEQ